MEGHFGALTDTGFAGNLRRVGTKWSELRFGRHQGKSLPQLVFADCDWFWWAWEQNLYRGDLGRQSDDVAQRAANIRLPQIGTEVMVAEYVPNEVGLFASLEVVPKEQEVHPRAQRSDRIDLRMPRAMARGKDRLGGDLIIDHAKHILFGDAGYRMTRARCEAFFDDDRNFVLGPDV